MSLPYYNANEMEILLKHLEPNIADNFKLLDNDKKRYVGSLILTNQIGGDTGQVFQEIRKGNQQIRLIANNLIKDIKSKLNKLNLTDDKTKDLVNQVKVLKEKIKQLEDSCGNKKQNIDDTCNEKQNKYEEYLKKFIEVQTSLTTLVSKIKDSADNSNLNVLPKNGERSINSYISLLEKVNNEKDKIKVDNINCDNVDAALEILENYANPQLYQRIIDDFENISGTVRVYARILNRSVFDPLLQIKEKNFNHIISPIKIKNKTGGETEVLKKIPQKHQFNCNTNLCPAPQSVQKFDKFIKKTKYPCNDSDEIEPFKAIYGPFFSVFENNDNETVYKGNNKDPGIQNIIQQILSGIDVVLFSYGLSGSGKSFTLLGAMKENGEKGMVQLTIDELLLNGANITLQIEELYGKLNPRNNEINTKHDKLDTIIISSSNDIISKINEVNEIRKNNGRIKFTPNNPESSRSHLFLKFFIKYKNKDSLLTFIDMAGVEDPFVIANTFLPIHNDNLKLLNRDTIKSLITDISNPKSNSGDSLRFSKTYWEQSFLNSPEVINLVGEKKTKNPDSCNKNKVTIADINTISRKDKMVISFNDHCDAFDDLMYKIFIIHIKKNIFNNNEALFNSLFMDDSTKQINIDKIVDYIWNILQEGFYINETLNHLRIFLLERMNKKVKIVNAVYYNKERINAYPTIIYPSITTEQFKIGDDISKYSNNKLFNDPFGSDQIKMLSLLKSLFRDNNDKRPKFVMMVNVRTDLNTTACSGTASTLDFADSVKST